MKVPPIQLPENEKASPGLTVTVILRPRAGTGDRGGGPAWLYDPRHFTAQSSRSLFARDLLRGTALIGWQSRPEDADVTCSACGALVGTNDDDLPLIKLHKWSVSIRQSASAPWERNSVENFICAQLLELMDAQGIRKFMAYHGKLQDVDKGMLLWVLIPDFKYSASCITDGQPRRAMKILYQKTPKPREFMDANHENVDEFPLPAAILETITENLKRSNRLLPNSAQKFQNWKVGLLDRFDPQ